MMRVIRHEARALVQADGITIVLRDDDLCFYADEEAIGPLWKGRRFPMATCVSGWVMQRGTTAVIPDVYADERVPADAYRPTFVKSLMMVPVGQAFKVAAIGAYWATPHTATADEIARLQAVAAAAARVLEQICPRCHMRGFVEALEEGTADDGPLACVACDYARTA